MRSAVVSDLDVPASLLAGDRAVLPLRLENIDFSQSDFILRLAATGPIKGLTLSDGSEAPRAPAPQAEIKLVLPRADAAKVVYVAIEAVPDSYGKATLTATIDPVDKTVPLTGNTSSWTFDVRSPALSSVETVSFPVTNRPQSLWPLIDGLIVGNYIPESVLVTSRFADDPRPLLASSAAAPGAKASFVLDHLVWQGLRELYRRRAGGPARAPKVEQMLGQVLSLQLPNGSFVPYRTVGDFAAGEITFISQKSDDNVSDGLLRTAMALDLLTAAKDAGYEVPSTAVRSARQFVQSRIQSRDPQQQSDCSFDLAFGIWALVRAGARNVDENSLDALTECKANLDVIAAAAAALARYGLSVEAKAVVDQIQSSDLSAIIKDLSDYQAAMVLEFLAEAGAPASLIETIANDLLKSTSGSAISEAALAWAARASETSSGQPQSRLNISDLSVEGLKPGDILTRSDGVIETKPIPFSQLKSISVSTRGNLDARGTLTIEGLLARPAPANRLPVGAVRRRFFNIETGKEINVARDAIDVGQELLVVLEGNHQVLPQSDAPAQPDLSPPEGNNSPLLIADLLPSAFQVISSTPFEQSGIVLHGDAAQLKPLGNLRSVETALDRWIALVIPESWRQPSPNGDGSASPGPEAPPVPQDRPPPGPPAFEFRQAYLVRVVMAGHFTVPPISVESTAPPIRTLIGEPTTLEIRLASAAR